MAQEIEVVCKRNEARSPFLAAFLKLHLPDLKLSSSGVSVTQHKLNDPSAQNIAAEWGFGYHVAKVKATSKEVASRLYLPVDSLVQSELEKTLSPSQILAIDLEKNSSTAFTPLDPVNCNQNEMKIELSKLLGFGVSHVRQFISSQLPLNVEAIIPQNTSSVVTIFSDLLERRSHESLIIVDASLKLSNRKLIQPKAGELLVPLDPPVPGSIYSSIFEFTAPEKLLCSLQWREWLFRLAEISKVIIVSPPLVDEEGNKIHDSHLAAIWAEDRILS